MKRHFTQKEDQEKNQNSKSSPPRKASNVGNNISTIGERLKFWRKSVPLTLTDLSKRINVSSGSLSDLENNKSQPSASTLANLYLVFNLNICWLLTGKESSPLQVLSTREKSFPHPDLTALTQDKTLNEMVHRLVRTYQSGSPQDIAFINGFLLGVDPKKNELGIL